MIGAARLECDSGLVGRIQYRALSLLRQKLTSTPLAGAGGSNHASPELHGKLPALSVWGQEIFFFIFSFSLSQLVCY